MPSDFLQIARLLRRRTALVLLAAFDQFLQGVLPKDLPGKVIGFLDADTIEVLHNNCAEGIRLNGIDCPGRASLGTSADHPGEEVKGTQMAGVGGVVVCDNSAHDLPAMLLK